jgi:hypothetical protein
MARKKRRKELPGGGNGRPEVKIAPLLSKEEIEGAIADIMEKRKRVLADIADNEQIVKDLEVRQAHYQQLLDAGKYDATAMQKSMRGMDVEIRRYQDKNVALRATRSHYAGIIAMLRGKLAELQEIFGT